MQKGPHGGQLVAIPDERGFVEWVTGSRRLYYLDQEQRPLPGVTDAVLWVATETGPRQVELRDCGDPQSPEACDTAAGDWLSADRGGGVVRFTLGTEEYRVLLFSRPRDGDVEGPRLPALPIRPTANIVPMDEAIHDSEPARP